MEKKELLNKHQEKKNPDVKQFLRCLCSTERNDNKIHYIKVKDVLRDSIMNFQNSRDREKLLKASTGKRSHKQKIREQNGIGLHKSNTRKGGWGGVESNIRSYMEQFFQVSRGN